MSRLMNILWSPAIRVEYTLNYTLVSTINTANRV